MREILDYERLLPDFPASPSGDETDTSLHAMSGPPIETPGWVVDSWRRAAEQHRRSEETIVD